MIMVTGGNVALQARSISFMRFITHSHHNQRRWIMQRLKPDLTAGAGRMVNGISLGDFDIASLPVVR